MNRSFLSIVVVLACAPYAVAQTTPDTNPTAPLGLAAEAVNDEALRVHWMISYGNSATTGGDTTKDADALAAAVAGVAVADKGFAAEEFGTGGTTIPANGFADHYVLRRSTSPITTADPGEIVDANIPATKTGTGQGTV